jgi:hypothetical protein
MVLLYIKDGTTVKELKAYLAEIPDDAVIQYGSAEPVRLDKFQKDGETTLYIDKA